MKNNNVEIVEKLLRELKYKKGKEAVTRVARFLGYELYLNPIEIESDWYLFSHSKLDDQIQSVMTIKYDENLEDKTSVRELRKRYEEVEEQKENFKGYDIYLYAFVGRERILIFRGYDSNRDERLDISLESINKVSLFADNFIELKSDRIQIEEDEFGYGNMVVGLDRLFTRELNNLFELTIKLYRKHIAELIVKNENLESYIMELLPEYDRKVLKKQTLDHKLLNLDFKQAIGSVVDTIILRVILRRFLESYHGLELFSEQGNFNDLGLGHREGKMQEVITQLAEIKQKNITEKHLKSAIEEEESGQASFKLFDEATQEVEWQDEKVAFSDIYDRLRKQFELAYGGDLFAGDISLIVNKVEREINNICPTLLLNFIADTSEERFNFRYEDLPPSMIQEFYESSMGNSISYKINKSGESIVSYSEDSRERKHKGAYYTKSELVDYMVKRTIDIKLNNYLKELKEGVNERGKKQIENALENISAMKIIDITCGGGSFLRGAFRYLAAKRETIIKMLEPIRGLEFYKGIINKYPYFSNSEKAEAEWEKHVLLRMIYGKDIDYKALVISSQTLTLSALNKWKIGENFPNMIGLTLIQQNALISPISVSEREELLLPYKEDIAKMIQLKEKIIEASNPKDSKRLSKELDTLRLSVQEDLYENIKSIIKEEYREALMPHATEINFPEVFFNKDGSIKEDGGFDISLGNPPWEIWKLNAEEFFEPYDSNFRNATRAEKNISKEKIFEMVPTLKEKWDWQRRYYAAASDYFRNHKYYSHQKTKVDGKMTSSDINLYKISVERNYQLLSQRGICGYLLPSGMYTDLGSTALRKLLFNKTNLIEVASFENRKKLFKDIDSRLKFAVVVFEKGIKSEDILRGFFYKTNLASLYNDNEFLKIPISLVKKISPNSLSIMEFRDQKEVIIMEQLVKFPMLGDRTNKNWNLHFTTDFHMTNDSHLFSKDELGIELYEGRTIWQYDNKNEKPKYRIEENKGALSLINREIKRMGKEVSDYLNKDRKEAVNTYFQQGTVPLRKVKLDYLNYRIAYRDIASSTNKRSLIATVIPPKKFAGNKLPTAKPFVFSAKENKYVPLYSKKESLVIIALLNSFIVDFVIRRKVSSTLNYFYVYQLPVPRLSEDDLYFNEIKDRSGALVCTSEEYNDLKLQAGLERVTTEEKERQLLKNQIDAYVTKIYGLTRDELLYILSTFKSPKHRDEMQDIAQGVIEQFDILEKEGGLEWPK